MLDDNSVYLHVYIIIWCFQTNFTDWMPILFVKACDNRSTCNTFFFMKNAKNKCPDEVTWFSSVFWRMHLKTHYMPSAFFNTHSLIEFVFRCMHPRTHAFLDAYVLKRIRYPPSQVKWFSSTHSLIECVLDVCVKNVCVFRCIRLEMHSIPTLSGKMILYYPLSHIMRFLMYASKNAFYTFCILQDPLSHIMHF
jgi:hypothetical protein